MSDIYDKRHVMTKRFPALPDISRGGEVASPGSQLVPYQNEDIYGKLENRISMSEKSSRSLLEEVVRLQNENKVMQRNTDEFMREEYKRRQHMAMSLQSSFNDLTTLQTKQKHLEGSLETSVRNIASIGARCTTVENVADGSGKEIKSQRDAFLARLEQLREGMEEARHSRTQLERLSIQLSDDLRQQRSAQIVTQRHLESFGDEMTRRCLKIEDDAARSSSTLRTTGQQQQHLEQTWTQLRVQIETRLSELRDIFTEQRKTQDSETKERHILQQQTQINLADIRAHLQRSGQEHNEALRSQAVDQHTRLRELDTQVNGLRGAVAQSAEEMAVRYNQRENKLRDENSARYEKLEEMIIGEMETRQRSEHSNRDALEVRWGGLQRSLEEDTKLKDTSYNNDRRKVKETLNKLNEAILLVESQLGEQKRTQEKLITAEIQSRQQSEKNTIRKLDTLQLKLSTATASLTHNLNASSLQANTKIDKLAAEIIRLQEISTADSDKGKLADRLDELQQGVTAKIDVIQSGLRKLAETVQTVKTVLSIKHQAEQKNRCQGQNDSREAVVELAKIIDKLLIKEEDDGWNNWKEHWLPILEKEAVL